MFEGLFGDLYKQKEGLPKFYVFVNRKDKSLPFEIKDNQNKSLGFASTEEDAIFVIKEVYKNKGIKIELSKENNKYIPLIVLN